MLRKQISFNNYDFLETHGEIPVDLNIINEFKEQLKSLSASSSDIKLKKLDTPSNENTMATFALVDSDGNEKGSVLDIPKDRFIKEAKYDEASDNLNITFIKQDGSEEVVAISLKSLADDNAINKITVNGSDVAIDENKCANITISHVESADRALTANSIEGHILVNYGRNGILTYDGTNDMTINLNEYYPKYDTSSATEINVALSSAENHVESVSVNGEILTPDNLKNVDIEISSFTSSKTELESAFSHVNGAMSHKVDASTVDNLYQDRISMSAYAKTEVTDELTKSLNLKADKTDVESLQTIVGTHSNSISELSLNKVDSSAFTSFTSATKSALAGKVDTSTYEVDMQNYSLDHDLLQAKYDTSAMSAYSTSEEIADKYVTKEDFTASKSSIAMITTGDTANPMTFTLSELIPNTYYNITGSYPTIEIESFASGTEGFVNEYKFQFTSQDNTATTLSFGNGIEIKWRKNSSITASSLNVGSIYRVSIINGLGTIEEF